MLSLKNIFMRFNYKSFLIVFIILQFSFYSCQKEPKKTLPELTTVEVSNITLETAQSGGFITKDGGVEVSARGVCWSKNQNPTIHDSKTIDGNGIGSFLSELNNLSPGETYFVRSYATNLVGTAYGNQLQFNAESRIAEKNIIASVGGVITTFESIKLVIPPDALLTDGVVKVGRIGDEPNTVPNKYLKVASQPISISIPSEIINKPLQLSYPTSESIVDTTEYSVFVFDGSTYIPLKYSIKDGIITVEIDVIKSDSINPDTKSYGKIIIIATELFQNPINILSELGLMEASIVGDKISLSSFNSQQQVSSSDTVLLMIHGWGGWPSTWEFFLKRIYGEQGSLNYNKFWTFGYNSSKSINENGQILKELLAQHSNGATIDIIAHSMGGLVSRSMIEKYNGARYVNRLVTLGTPHKGSPLAALRYAIGLCVAMDNIYDFFIYNNNTKGFADLYTYSQFISQMNSLIKPEIPYYTIACKSSTSNPFINGDDDGVVSVISAKGVNEAGAPEDVLELPYIIAHLKMRESETLFLQIKDYLLKKKPTVYSSQVDLYTANNAIIGGEVVNDGGYPITERGVFWGPNPDLEKTGSKLVIGNGVGKFSTSLTGLNPETKYYVKAYAKNTLGYGYGSQTSFTTFSYLPNSIVINSFPAGASIYLNGTNMNAVTPHTILNVNSGNHHIRLYKFGYNEYNKSITLSSGGYVTVNADLGNPTPPLPFFTIYNPVNNSTLTNNVLTITGKIVLKSSSGEVSQFTPNKAVLTLNGVDQDINVINGLFSQQVLIKSGENRMRLRANSPNGDTGLSDEFVFYGDFSVPDIQIILRWSNGTSSDKKDVDLHVFDSNNRHTYWMCTSAYSNMPEYTYARENMIPNSNLDIDNIIGYGPETFTLSKSTNTVYTIKVHFYSGYSRYNPTDANIQLIIGGTILKTYGPFRFKNSYDNVANYNDPNCWWEVVSFSYYNGIFTIVNPAQSLFIDSDNTIFKQSNSYKK